MKREKAFIEILVIIPLCISVSKTYLQKYSQINVRLHRSRHLHSRMNNGLLFSFVCSRCSMSTNYVIVDTIDLTLRSGIENWLYLTAVIVKEVVSDNKICGSSW